MGVPGLVRFLEKKYQDVFFYKEISPYALFIDFNGIVYKMIAYTMGEIGFKDEKKFEKRLKENVGNYLIKVINEIVKPTHLVYIAFDGVPPFGKIKQQRERRFKNLYQTELIKQKYPTFDTWNSNQISPGTEFMQSLQNDLLKKIDNPKVLGERILIYDDANIPGEGEHKFFKIFRKIRDKKHEYVIYSDDADLLILSLPFSEYKIYLMRDIEKTGKIKEQYPDSQEFIFINVNLFMTRFCSFYGYDNMGNTGKDILFLSMLEGNDFVEPILFIPSSEDTLNTIFNIYKSVHQRLRINLFDGNNNLNKSFFKMFLELLSNQELEKLQRKQAQKSPNRNFEITNTLESYRTIMDHSFYNHPANPFKNKYFKTPKVNFHSPNWKDEYYKLFFGDNYSITQICNEYFASLSNTFSYYMGMGTNWSFNYAHDFAPLPSDLLSVIQGYQFVFLEKSVGKPILPFCQLLAILPEKSAEKLLPKKITQEVGKNERIKNILYPKDINVNFRGFLTKFIYSKLKIPMLKLDELNKIYGEIMENVKLTKKEEERNTNNKKAIMLKGKISRSVRESNYVQPLYSRKSSSRISKRKKSLNK